MIQKAMSTKLQCAFIAHRVHSRKRVMDFRGMKSWFPWSCWPVLSLGQPCTELWFQKNEHLWQFTQIPIDKPEIRRSRV